MSSASSAARIARLIAVRLAWLAGGFALPVTAALTWVLPHGPVRTAFMVLLMAEGVTLFVRMSHLRVWLNEQAEAAPAWVLNFVGPFAALSFATISAVSLTELITPLWFVLIGALVSSFLARRAMSRRRKTWAMVGALVALWTLEGVLGLGSPVDLATKSVAYTASAIALSMEVLLVFRDHGYLTLREDLPERARAERLAARRAAEWDAARRSERERRRRNIAARRAVLAAYR